MNYNIDNIKQPPPPPPKPKPKRKSRQDEYALDDRLWVRTDKRVKLNCLNRKKKKSLEIINEIRRKKQSKLKLVIDKAKNDAISQLEKYGRSTSSII